MFTEERQQPEGLVTNLTQVSAVPDADGQRARGLGRKQGVCVHLDARLN